MRQTGFRRAVGMWVVMALGALVGPVFGQSPEIIWQQHFNSDRINAVVFSPNGNTFITGSSDRLINFWRTSDGALLKVLNSNAPAIHESSIESLAISGDGNYLASASFQAVRIWNLATDTVRVIRAGNDWNVNVAFSPNNALVASASFDTLVRVYRVSDGVLIKSLSGHQNVARAVAFSPDGNYLATASGDATVRIYRTSDWGLVRTLQGHTSDIYDIAFSPDSAYLGSGSYDHTAKIWNVSDGTLRATGQGNGNVYAVGFTPDSALFAFADGEANTLRLLRVSDGALLRSYKDQVNNVQALAFSPTGGGLMGYGRADGTVLMSRVSTTATSTSTPPQVALVSPGNGDSFVAPARVVLSANATARNGIRQVEFFQNGISLGTATVAPYTLAWNGVTSGSYALTAVVTDRLGVSARSGAITINVRDPVVDNSIPSIVISSPAQNARFNIDTITLSGHSSDNLGVARIVYAVNDGTFQTASGTTSWQATAALSPGVNRIQVKAIDQAGNESAVATRTVTYVLNSVLSIQVNGAGRVEPNLNGRLLEVGRTYTLTAVPLPGYIFDGWNGSAASNSNVLRFTMTDGAHLQANFVLNPFVPVQGTYRGLILSGTSDFERSGYIRVSTTPQGLFSGRLVLGRRDAQLVGRFNANGSYTTIIPGTTPLTINLQLHLDGSDQITGRISDANGSSTVLALRGAFSARNPSFIFGRYTFLIPSAAGGPTGYGYGVATIDRLGNVIVNGSLADGTAFGSVGALSSEGTFALYAQLYGGRGSILGFVTVENSGTADMDGTLNWFRPAMPGARYFADGFATQVPFAGSAFSQVGPGTRVLNLSDSGDNAVVRLVGGNLNGELDKLSNLSNSNRLIPLQPGEDRLSLSISPGTGLFSGSFVHPTLFRVINFRGVVFQKQNSGAGYFLGNDQAGAIFIEPAP